MKTAKIISKSDEELFQDLSTGWNNIERSYLKALVDSIARRIKDVIKNKGFPTKC
jgi:hypothetical protein